MVIQSGCAALAYDLWLCSEFAIADRSWGHCESHVPIPSLFFFALRLSGAHRTRSPPLTVGGLYVSNSDMHHSIIARWRIQHRAARMPGPKGSTTFCYRSSGVADAR